MQTNLGRVDYRDPARRRWHLNPGPCGPISKSASKCSTPQSPICMRCIPEADVMERIAATSDFMETVITIALYVRELATRPADQPVPVVISPN